MNDPFLSRRQFFRAGAGAVVVVGLGACDRGASGRPASTSTTVLMPTSTVSTVPGATSSVPSSSVFGGKRLVIVQLNGGNDLLNTMPPADGRYMDLRPTIGIPESDRVALKGVVDASLHPSLAGLSSLWEDGRLAIVQGIGFEDPNRSHFVSMARWWRADDLAGAGWLGRALDGLATEPSPLFASAVGGSAPLLSGVNAQPTVISSPGSFRFAGVDPGWVRAMSGDGEGLVGAARHAYGRAVDAVVDFAALSGAPVSSDDLPEREGGATIAGGLAVAAQMLAGDVGTQIVVVSAGGFDTHSQQLTVHAGLLQDLADGLVAFQDAIAAAGLADDVLVVTTSEFGRRAAENGSAGCDHGAGGLTLALGNGVRGGMYGSVDLGDLLDGDVRPVVDPRALYADCLTWLQLEPEALLGTDTGIGLLA